MVFIVGSYMSSSSSMTSCTPVVRNKMEIYTIKASIKQAFRQNYTEERRVGDYAAAKNLDSCLLARLAVECYAQRRQLPLHDADFHKGLITHLRGGQPGQAYAAIVQSLDTLPMWREPTTQDLVAQLEGRAESHGVSPSLRKWFIRYANSVKLWFIPCAPYRKFAREIVPLLKRYNIVVDLNMVNEDHTTVVCPHCHAPYKRVRPRDDQHVHPHRVMLCENPQCRGAQWRATVPDALNVDHRDKSAAENILWRSLATEDEHSGSPFSRTSIPRLPTSFQYHQLANRQHSSTDG
ncbi:hypothetical protein J8273_1176 [Carpediemonas membranifera]|uniref:Uncharacterized protein n=1 Tax=Carpediemonas membranifera TaxID=201153 RepID=A0A8J6AXG6_9EUKA|nr:hypothetical protein J8273_1176 [Carpediemonas membranifera]|eukprot:KAG9397261.1 hypothetical protein J8273_1176 [Carpediemonas membranifera]